MTDHKVLIPEVLDQDGNTISSPEMPHPKSGLKIKGGILALPVFAGMLALGLLLIVAMVPLILLTLLFGKKNSVKIFRATNFHKVF